jgi:hypothetical protein
MGFAVGLVEGTCEGSVLGACEGFALGVLDGLMKDGGTGLLVGLKDGETVGKAVIVGVDDFRLKI